MTKPRKLGTGLGGTLGCPQFSQVYRGPFKTIVKGSNLLSAGTKAYYSLSHLLHIGYRRIRLFL